MPAKPPPNATPRGRRAPARRSRLLPALGAAVLLLLAAGHTAGWAWLCGQLEAGLSRWAAERRAEGWEVAHGEPRHAGWPLRVAVELPGVVLRQPGLGWRAEQVRLELVGPGLDRLRIAATGAQGLELAGQPVPMAAEGLQAELPIGPDAQGAGGLPREAALRAAMLRLDLPAGPLRLEGLRLDLASRAGAGAGEPLAVLDGLATRVVLPPEMAAAPGIAVLGPVLEALRLDLAVTGPWPGAAGQPATRAARWRDAGGAVELRGLALRWGEAEAKGSAVLALDEALQPAGAGTLRLAGAPAVLRAAQTAGMVGRREAAAAQLLLAMMQRTPPEGGPPQLEVPVVLEQRALSLGGLPLLRLPSWRWPPG